MLALLPNVSTVDSHRTLPSVVIQMRFMAFKCAEALALFIMPSFLEYFPPLASESHNSPDFPPMSLAPSSKSCKLAPTFLLHLYNLKLPEAKSLDHFSSPSSLSPWWSHPVHHFNITYALLIPWSISPVNISLLAFLSHPHFYIKPNIKPEKIMLKNLNILNLNAGCPAILHLLFLY